MYTVKADEDGWVLKSVLQRRLGVSRKLLSRLKLTEKGIMLNGKRQYINVIVHQGDLIELYMEQETSEDILPEPVPIFKLFEDEHLLVVNKQAGLIVHPTHGHYTGTLANGVVYDWKQRGLRHRFRPVHRLDQETSGVLAIAKNPYAHQAIAAQLIEGEVKKSYLAIVHGRVETSKGTIDAPIDRDPEQPHVRIVMPKGSQYPAVTHYEVVKRWPVASLVRIQLETGRTHQIRVHMKHLGHPLVGDKMYGNQQQDEQFPIRIERQALHAALLSFRAPVSGEVVTFEAPVTRRYEPVDRNII